MQSDTVDIAETESLERCNGDNDPGDSLVEAMPIDPPPPEGEKRTPFISCPVFFLEELIDLHKSEEDVVFKNRDGDMTFVLQTTSEATDEMMTFDLSYMYDEDEDRHGKIRNILDMEYNASQSDESLWTFYTFAVGKDPPLSEISEMADALDSVYSFRFCECFEYFVKNPDRHLCSICRMRREEREDVRECVICSELILTSRGRVLKSCCGQYMHRRCVEMWRRDNASKSCPICRKSLTETNRS